jgi:NDP-sugar pyrophosphorylase family protein
LPTKGRICSNNSKGNKVGYYPILGYWLDIGKYDDFIKAQKDISSLNLIHPDRKQKHQQLLEHPEKNNNIIQMTGVSQILRLRKNCKVNQHVWSRGIKVDRNRVTGIGMG